MPRERSAKRSGPGPRLYFAAAGALGVIVAAGAALVAVTGDEGKPRPHAFAVAPANVAASGPSPVSYSSSPSGRTYEAIAQRSADAKPLTLEQMFPESATTIEVGSKARLKLRDKRVDADCGAAIWGAPMAQEVARGGCNQAVRSLFADKGYALSVTVLNLNSAADADRMVDTLGRVRGGGFVQPLPARAPLNAFGRGFGMARGLAVGHYAVVAWAQRLDGKGDERDETLLSLLIEGGKARGVLARAAHAR